MKAKRLIAITMTFIMILSVFSGMNWSVKAKEAKLEEDKSTEITVHFYNDNNWKEPRLYYYNGNKKGQDWPGETMEDEGDGWYSYVIEDYKEAKVLFNDGKEEQIPAKYEEGFTVSEEMWYKDGKWFTEEPSDIIVHFCKPFNWTNVNLYYYKTENDTGKSWPGEAMNTEGDDWYSFTITKYTEARVLFNNGAGEQIPERNEKGFLVSDEMWYKDGKWFTEEPKDIVVHFYNPNNWNTPNLYYYKTTTETGPNWPGEKMTDELDGWYHYAISEYLKSKILFNDGNNQIPDKMQEGFEVTKEIWYKNGTWYNKNPDYEEDADTDGDGILDIMEVQIGTNRLKADTDGDHLPDGYEFWTLGTDPLKKDTNENGLTDEKEDFDADGLTNLEEYQYGTSPFHADTDEDHFTDKEECEIYHTDPLNPDTDGDKLLDGDEPALGFNPLLYDTDGNGICDGDEKVLQTLAQEIEQEGNDEVTKVEVSFEENGKIDNSTTIENMYGIDILASDVEGLVGVPVDIQTSSEFETATLTFTYDDTKLNNIKEENLAILWYDEEDEIYHLLEDCVVDTKKNTVCATTTHFSTYMLVDKQQWYETWKNAISYENRGTPDSLLYYDIMYVIDKSISMSGENLTETKKVVKSFIDVMEDNDRGGIVTFDEKASLLSPLGTSKVELKETISRIVAGGGTDTNEGLLMAIKELCNQNNAENKKMIILLCDGDVNYVETTINKAIENQICIYTVLIGDQTGKALLEDISSQTGGKSYYVANAEELETIFSEIKEETMKELDTTDSDGDGLYDIYEKNGMTLPNGKVIYTDPYNKDSDGDGLTDFEETGEPILCEMPIGTEKKGIVSAFASKNTTLKNRSVKIIKIKCNPKKKDTDGDGIPDKEDPYPKKVFSKNNLFLIKDVLGYKSYATNNMLDKDITNIRKLYESKKLTDKERKTILKKAKNLTNIFSLPYPKACSFLKHYLNGNGKLKKFDAMFVIMDYNSGMENYINNINKLFDACEKAVKKGYTQYIVTSPNKNFIGCQYTNWAQTLSCGDQFLTLGNANAAITCKCTYDGTYYVIIFDYYILDHYNWNPNNNIQMGIPFAACSEEELYKLHLDGSAKSFKVVGKTKFQLKWKKGMRIKGIWDDIIYIK